MVQPVVAAMRKKGGDNEAASALNIAEEAIVALRRAPAAVLATYAIGTVPFLLGLLFFCTDMARSGFATERLPTGALGMALLFIWMKVWHAEFARRLRRHIASETATPVTVDAAVRAIVLQATIQCTGLFLMPVALVLVIPFNWVYPFYQNATALGFREGLTLRELVKQSWAQAALWPVQNIYLLLLFKTFGLFVFLNVVSAFFSVPFLLKTLFGTETRLTQLMQDPMTLLAIFFNTTVFSALVGISYLCLDPILKTIYVLRCFYGESISTGEDLKVELRRLRTPAAVTVLLAICCIPALGGEARTETEKLEVPRLERSIEEVLQQREYVWRMPRERAEKPKSTSMLSSFIEAVFEMLRDAAKAVFQALEKFLRWIFGNRNFNFGGGGSSGVPFVQLLLYGLAGVLIVAVMWLFYQIWRRRPRPEEVMAQPLPAVPDVADENVGADRLPEEGWLKLARELIERGELRLAIRAYYLASLAHLAERNLVTLAKHKSNRDYQVELERRAHALGEVFQLFRENVSVFDRIWYGLHEVNRDLVERFAQNALRIHAA